MGNPIVHVEVVGPDPDRLRTFYAALFGWDAPPGAPVAPAISATDRYAFVEPPEGAPPVPGGIGGGEGFEPHSLFYVGVADVGAALRRAEELGGTVALEAQVNEAGGVVVGHLRDPAGNLVGVAAPR